MQLVDTHCHIQSVAQSPGEHPASGTGAIWAKGPGVSVESIINNAAEAGVTKLICVGCDLVDSKNAISFVQQYPNAWASIGIRPHEAHHVASNSDKLAEFAALATADKVVAIGECGLDYFYEHSPKADQIALLTYQIELALAHNLPLIFHVREAFDNFWPIFDQYQGIRGVVHSFTDNQANLERALERGLYIGVNGIATFAKSVVQLDIYRAVPLSKLLLETDAPFLTPAPYRGTINEPKRVETIARYLAKIRDEDLDHLAAVTTSNAHDLFGI